MQAINKQAKAVLLKLIEQLQEKDLGDMSAIVDNSEGAFMAVHVSQKHDDPRILNSYRTEEGKGGTVYSIAHYYTQEGDLMSDPYMEFLEGFDGNFYPVTFEQHGWPTMYQHVLVYDDEKMNVKGYHFKAQQEQTDFANQWLENIKFQQGV